MLYGYTCVKCAFNSMSAVCCVVGDALDEALRAPRRLYITSPGIFLYNVPGIDVFEHVYNRLIVRVRRYQYVQIDLMC